MNEEIIEEMTIINAQYIADMYDSNENESIKATIDGVEMTVPIAEGNRHYDEIMRQVDAGTLTIEDAE